MAIVERQVADAVSKGARVLIGGKRAERGLFYPPTVLVDVDHAMACMREETFGPLLPIMKVADEQEAVALANDSNYGLTCSVWTTSKERAKRVSKRIEAGSVNVNNVMTNAFQFPLPMGGWKESGLGHRMGGPDGIRKYCRQQAVVGEKINIGNESHWYPHTQRKARLTSRVLRLIEMHDWRRRRGRARRGSGARRRAAAGPRAASAVRRRTRSRAPARCRSGRPAAGLRAPDSAGRHR